MTRSLRARARPRENPTRTEHDPRAPGWADVRQGMIDATSLVVLAVAKLAGRDPGDAERPGAWPSSPSPPWSSWGEIGRRWVLDEAVLADVDQRAYDRGVRRLQGRAVPPGRRPRRRLALQLGQQLVRGPAVRRLA